MNTVYVQNPQVGYTCTQVSPTQMRCEPDEINAQFAVVIFGVLIIGLAVALYKLSREP